MTFFAMKTPITTLLLASLLTFNSMSAVDADTDAPAPPATGEMAALEHFLDLSDEDLDQMQQVITRIRAMSPEEKTALRIEMERFRQLPPMERRQLRLGWGALEEKLQDAWRRMMQGATPELRAEIRTELQLLPPEEKGSYRRQMAEKFLEQEAKKK